MPKSRVRQKAAYTPPPSKSAAKRVSAPWVVPGFIACMIVGLAWIVTYYATNQSFMSVIGGWNLVVGFTLIIIGLGFMTQWR